VILVAGEALVDMTPAGCGEAIGYLPRPGRSPYNVAIGLGRLDVPVAFLGRLSTGPRLGQRRSTVRMGPDRDVIAA
jgi:fructokinase